MRNLILQTVEPDAILQFNRYIDDALQLLGKRFVITSEKQEQWDDYVRRLDQLSEKNTLLALKIIVAIAYKDNYLLEHNEENMIGFLRKKQESYFLNQTVSVKERIAFGMKVFKERPSTVAYQFKNYFTQPIEQLFIELATEDPQYILEQFDDLNDKPNRSYIFDFSEHRPIGMLEFARKLKDIRPLLFVNALSHFLSYYNSDWQKEEEVDSTKIRDVSFELYNLIAQDLCPEDTDIEKNLQLLIRFSYRDEPWYDDLCSRLWHIESDKKEMDKESLKNYFLIAINCVENSELTEAATKRFALWSESYQTFDMTNQKLFTEHISQISELIKDALQDTHSQMRNISFPITIERKILDDLPELCWNMTEWIYERDKKFYFQMHCVNFGFASSKIEKFEKRTKQMIDIFIERFTELMKTDIDASTEILGILLKKSSFRYKGHIDRILNHIYFLLEEIAPQRAKEEIDKVLADEEEYNRHYDRGGPYYWTPERAVADNEAPEELLRKLSNSQNNERRKEIATNKNTPPDVLEQLCQDEYPEVRNRAINNKSLTIHILEKLSKDENIEVRARVALNGNMPVYLLEQLSQDENARVRSKVASNINTPIKTFIKLSEDSEVMNLGEHNPVYQALRDDRASEKLLRHLSASKNDEIKKIIACHMKTPPDILEQLCQSENVKVRISVAKNKNTPANALKLLSWDQNADIQASVSANPNTDIEVLRRLVNENNNWPSIADNPNISQDIIIRLSKSDDYSIRSSIAQNLKTSSEILRELSKDPAPHVRTSVAKNNNTPEDILNILSTDHGETTKKFRNEERIKIGEFQRSLLRQLWDNFNTINLLTKVFYHGTDQNERFEYHGTEIRKKVATNKNTSLKTLKNMLYDDDSSIVELVERVLKNREKDSK
jgi:hypothetical protein